METRCGLCGEERELRVSHCIPSGITKLCVGYIEPILIVDGVALASSYEAQKPFLCSECEQRFNDNGENLTIRICLKGPGDFPFRDALRSRQPAANLGVSQAYLSDQLDTKCVAALKYFATSVFWRSSATRWKIAKGRNTRNYLGTRYTEQFRQFLHGEASFPANATMIARVADDDDLYPFFHWPHPERRHGYHEHVFSIPGMEFHLYVGGLLPKELVQIRKGSRTRIVFYLEPFRNSNLYEAIQKSTRGAVAKGKLKDWLKKNDRSEI